MIVNFHLYNALLSDGELASRTEGRVALLYLGQFLRRHAEK